MSPVVSVSKNEISLLCVLIPVYILSVSADIVIGSWFTAVESVAAVVDSELPLAADVVVSGSVVVHVIIVCSVVGIEVEEGEAGMPERINNADGLK